MLSPTTILEALDTIKETDGVRTLVSSGRISGISLRDSAVGFVLAVSAQEANHTAAMEAACERVLKARGASSITIVTTADNAPVRSGPARKSEWNSERLPHVHQVLAVASGKGGVGKSTTSVNLAHALAAQGKKVGLLDADIYGPSLPRMMGIREKPSSREGMIIPPQGHGITCLSMGMMMDESAAVVWRGPQVSRALAQMLRGAQWGMPEAPLDMLIIDLPPGTGDVHLSLVQQVPVDGVVIVTTPQAVAVADARKAIDMFRKVYVPLVGVIENMGAFVDASGMRHALFGEGGGAALAEACHIHFLGTVPLDVRLREAGDEGTVFDDKAGIYQTLAAKLFLP